MNLSDVLASTAERTPDRSAIVFGDERVSYGQLDADATRVASALANLGVDAGDRVGIWLPNDPAFASALYGAWRIGAVVVPVHAGLTRPEADHVLSDSGAQVVICGVDQYGVAGRSKLSERVKTVEHVVVCGEPDPSDLDWDAFRDAGKGSPAPTEVAPDHLALIAYTSGTSGLPKGAMLTHANLQANVDQMRRTPAGVEPDDVALCVIPLFHIFGLNVVLNLSVAVGATIVIEERFDPIASLAAVREHGVTIVFGVPTVYVAWLDLDGARREDFSDVRRATSGAAPLPKRVLHGFRDRFGIEIWEGYGLTETAPTLTTNAMADKPKAGSVGLALPGVEIRLLGVDGHEAEPGDPGEIVVRGPNVFQGYWQQPEENARVFRNGWFRTGDVGIFDDDGYLYLVDRRHDMIIVSGFNVYPKEVEEVLRAHPGVADCAVVGETDTYTGERVVAFVVAKDQDLDVDALGDHCRDHLASYKIPSEIRIASEIPRNAAGKVLKRVLREEASEA